MSCDPACPQEMAAMLGASLALCISDIPFDGPIAGVYVGRVNGKTRYTLEPDERIWIDQNKAALKASSKLNDNIIKLFLKLK